jgi:2-hydroxy-3-oxopropionate reductase
MKIGFIGLGVMGRPIAEHLLRAGHDLSVHARRSAAAAPLVAVGARACSSPAEAAAGAEVVFTMVTDSDDVRQVVLGDGGVIDGAAAGTVVVDMSTIAPGVARAVAAALAVRGVAMLDAPVSGGEAGARAGTLAIMAGGEAAALERVRPLLSCFARSGVRVGGAGAGQVAKACNQMVMVAAIEAGAEAARLAEAAGVAFERVREALLAGSAGSRVLEVFGARMAERNFAAGVEARLHHKDYAIVLGEAAAGGIPLPVAAAVGQQLNALMGRGWGRADSASLLRLLEAAPPQAA